MHVTFTGMKVPNETIILLGIAYEHRDAVDPDATRGMTAPKIFTYAALRAGGLWYVTGAGKSPTAAGGPAVDRWLAKEGRRIVWARVSLPEHQREITARVATVGRVLYRVDTLKA